MPAVGQDPAKPAPCVGYSAQDPAGDQAVGFAGRFTPAPASDKVDATGIFVRSEEGKGVKLFLQLTEASLTPPPETAAIGFRFLYSAPADLFLDVEIDKTGNVTYDYGHFGDTGPVGDGDTTGNVYEGKDGLIEVDLPESHGGKPGMKFGGQIFTWYSYGAVLGSTDFIPDGDKTFTFSGARCGGSTTVQPAPTTPGTPKPPSGAQTAPLGKLEVTAKPARFKAKKVKKGPRS